MPEQTTDNMWSRLLESSVPFMVARFLLGIMFLWMGLAKTGVTRAVIEQAGWRDSSVVRYMETHGWVELADPIDFLKLVHEYQMVPDRYPVVLNVIAAVLPWIEVVCGLLLLAGVAVRGTSLLLLIMLIGFTVVVAARAINIYQTQDIAFCAIKFDCGCGAGEEWICHKIPKNLGLCLLAVVTLVSRSRRWCLKKELTRSG